MTTFNIDMQQKIDTAANWTSNDPALRTGELGVESDTLRVKVGDGSTAWTSLAYATVTPALLVSTANGNGAALIGIEDVADLITATTVEGALAELAAGKAPLDVGPNAQSGTSYTLALSDAGQKVTMNNAGANTLTIPANASVAFPVGTIVGISQIGAGTTTVTGDTGVTVNGVSAGGADISAQYSGVTLTKIATDTWIMEGNHGTVA